MKILGLIPARGGSKGIPMKNIKVLGDRPLIAYTIEAGLASKKLSKLIVNTDSEEIAEVALSFGAEVPFMRPSELGADSVSSLAVVADVVSRYEKEYDAVCLLQPTSPFRAAGFIDSAIEKFIKLNCDSLVSVCKVPHQYNPHWAFEEDDSGLLRIATGEKHIISRRQDLPNAYHRDGSIYLTKTEVILKKNSLYGDSTSFIENHHDPINIDTPEDWKKAENYFEQQWR